MNKSLALKNKLYLFFSLLISFFIFLYLFYFLINGDRGIISYYNIKNQNTQHHFVLRELQKKNSFLTDRIKRLQTNTIDLDFLDEQIRQKTGYVSENEALIIFDQ
jgi:cell division protein FtsB